MNTIQLVHIHPFDNARLLISERANMFLFINLSTMKNWERFGIAIMSAWGLFAVHQGVNALVRAHNWQPMSISDWGTWVGSIGTVATLAGTIWLATADRREARKQANDRAIVAAAALGPRLQLIAGALDKSIQHFLDDPTAKQATDYKVYADLIEQAGTWTDEEILPLIVLPNHVCTRLAGIRPIKENVIKLIRHLVETYNYSWTQDVLPKRQGDIIAGLVRCRDVVQFAHEACASAVRKALPM